MSTPSPLPKTRRRWPWIFLGGFVLGSAVFIGLSLAPPVQGWLVRRFIARQPGWRLDFDRIGVGPNGLDASGLDFAMPGVTASSAPIAIRIAPTRLFSNRELRVERVEARKIQVVLTPAELGPSRVFDGVLHLLQVPLPWALDTAQLDGDLIVRDAGESRLKGNFSLHGGGITTATTGEFAYELSADSMILPPGPNHQFSSGGTLRLTQTPAHGIAHISVEGELRLPHYGKLALPPGRIALDITAMTGGEKYTGQLSLGNAIRLEVDATLEAATSKLTGHATLYADQTAAASLLGENLPQATIAGEMKFTLDFRTGDFDAAITGDLDARDWQKLMPQLSALDAFKGRLVAALNRHGEQLLLKSFDATLRGEKSEAEATIALTQPVDFKKIPASPLATIALLHWPVDWANPFLSDSGLQLAPGEFSAAWTISLDAARNIQLLPSQPATVGPILLNGAKSPGLPPLSLSFRSTIDVSIDAMKLSLDDFNAVSPTGDRVDAQLAFSREGSNGKIHTVGQFKGELPSVFSTANKPAPFTLNAKWDATQTGTQMRLSAFELGIRAQASTAPLLSLDLQKAFDFDLTSHAVTAVANLTPSIQEKSISADLLRLRFDHFPLAWLSRWLPGQSIAGTFVAGDSMLNASAEGAFTLHTSVPWQLEGLSVSPNASSAGLEFDAKLSPELSLRGDTLVAEIKNSAASDRANNRVTAQLGATAALATKSIKAEVALEADLPSLPHSVETFGALKGSLHAKFHTVTPRITGADEFDLRVSNAAGELFSLNAPLPFVFGLSNSDMVVMSTLAPLQVKTGGFPLSWLRPWSSGGLELGGTLDPMEFLLSSKIDHYSVRTTRPVNIDKFSARRDGHDLIRNTTITFEPGVDVSFLCKTQPKFEMAYSGMAHVTEAKAEISGRRAVDLDLGVAFKGNGSITLPDLIDLSGRVDFAALPDASALGLPARGIVVGRVNGDLLGGNPVELWVRLAGLPAAKSSDSLPPVEATVRGKISGFNVFAGGVELNLGTSPQPTDAAFEIKFNLVEGGLDITSGLHSRFMDGGALLELARSLPKQTTSVPSIPNRRKSTDAPKVLSASDATEPFWSVLTGSFDLDIGALVFAPYRIDHVRGRLDLTRSLLNLHDLGGEMFAGRWGGAVQIEHKPDNTTGEHTLAGEFHIEQFESARVIQTVFPHQLASVDARINVRSTVASHGNSFVSLLDQSTADFSVDGANGLIRLTVPKSDLMSTAAVFGGTVLLSPELRALGRLLKKFAEMPVEQLSIKGRRAAGGEVTLDELRFDSPQARLLGHGRILADASEPLMSHPLQLSLQLAAKDDLAVILGGMSLLEQKPQPNGFRAMREPFALGGLAGAPDTAPLYDLFAKAVSGSKGTWGFLMRKAQAEISRKKPTVTPSAQ